MGRVLIKNGYIVTMNPQREVFPNGYVLISDNQIAAVGEDEPVGTEETCERVIDAQGMLVIPGLINMHQHHWYTLFKGISEGFLLEDWLQQISFPLAKALEKRDLELSASLAAAEMLTTGTTCFFNHSVRRTTDEEFAAIVQPFLAAGIRHIYGKELREGEDTSVKEELSHLEHLLQRWQGAGDGLLRLGMVIETAAHWLKTGVTSEALIKEGVAYARRNGLKISNHITGATLWRTITEQIRLTGYNDVEYLARLGVLGDHFLLIHCVWLNEAEIKAVSELGGHIVLCPASGAFTAGGVAPAKTMLEAGLNLCLGSDGPMVNDSVDMLEQMKATALLQNAKYLTPAAISSYDLLAMSTINAAKALGLEKELGSLETGKKADLAIFDLQRPHYGVPLRPVANLIYSGKGTDAAYVFVNGELKVDRFRLVSVDWAALRAETVTRATRLVKQTVSEDYGFGI
jgi:5-methylthioadenosine/S-adenosylhomocysteine deaminase